MMNRRSFFAAVAALASLPVFGSRTRKPTDTSQPANSPSASQPVNGFMIVRATENLRGGQLVVWDGVDADGIPLVRSASNRRDFYEHVRSRCVGVTNCNVRIRYYTVVKVDDAFGYYESLKELPWATRVELPE